MANAAVHVSIATADGVRLETEAELVEIPALGERLGVMRGHTKSMVLLEPGRIALYQSGRASEYLTCGGFARVGGDRVTLMLFSLENALDVKQFSRECDHARTWLSDSEDFSGLDAAFSNARNWICSVP